jgi:hypothetical protein
VKLHACGRAGCEFRANSLGQIATHVTKEHTTNAITNTNTNTNTNTTDTINSHMPSAQFDVVGSTGFVDVSSTATLPPAQLPCRAAVTAVKQEQLSTWQPPPPPSLPAMIVGIPSLADAKLLDAVAVVTPELQRIAKGRLPSNRHSLFRKGGKARGSLKMDIRFGEISPHQQEVIMDELLELFPTSRERPMDYIFDVLFPECLVRLAMRLYRLSAADATKYLAGELEPPPPSDGDSQVPDDGRSLTLHAPAHAASMHSKKHGTVEGLFQCSAIGCYKRYAKQSSLNKHLVSHATLLPPKQHATPQREVISNIFVCNSFEVCAPCVRHRRREERDRIAHPCVYRVCGRAFRSESKLNDHINSHTGDRPYKCSRGCGNTFASWKRLKQHIAKVHLV